MNISNELKARCESKCEMCGSETNLNEYIVAPKSGESLDDLVAVCTTCESQMKDTDSADANHWRCLNESMWSTVPAVQVMSYRMLENLSNNEWAQDLLNMIYLDEPTLEWAQHGMNDGPADVHRDSNGQVLEAGDTVVLIKDLDVKGANFIAKRGTAVRRISLVQDNVEQIEGKVNDQHIVILTKFVKKS